MSDQRARDELGERLRANCPAPSSGLISTIVARIPSWVHDRPRASLRLALAAALTVALVTAVAAVGGVGYASKQVTHAVRAVKTTAVPTRSAGPTSVNSASDEYKGRPGIFGFQPQAACIGDRITVMGTNFIGTTSVLLGGISAKFQVKNDTSLFAWVPNGFTGGRITVTTPKGTVENEHDLKVKHPGCTT